MKNANLPFDRLMALSKVEGLRYPHSSRGSDKGRVTGDKQLP